MLRLAIVLEATAGGTRKHVRELALGLSPERFEIHLVLSFRRTGEMLRDLPAFRARGVRVHSVPMARKIHPSHDARALLELVCLFRRERFDVVHTHSAKAGFLGRLAARLTGIPRVVHTPHVWPFQWIRGTARGLYLAIERLAARWCDVAVCVGPGQRRIAREAGVVPAREADRWLRVIPNGIDVSLYDDPREGLRRVAGSTSWSRLRREVRAELGVREGELAIGMVARLAPQKGTRHFIDAADIVLREREDARFFLIGSGPLEEKLRLRAMRLGLGPKRLTFLGHREDVRRLYAGLDVFVLSSLYEGLPYVILEAAAAGLPVIATRVPGSEDVIEEGETGLLVSPDEPRAIAGATVKLLADPGLRRKLALAGRLRVEERFRLDRFLDSHERLYLGTE